MMNSCCISERTAAIKKLSTTKGEEKKKLDKVFSMCKFWHIRRISLLPQMKILYIKLNLHFLLIPISIFSYLPDKYMSGYRKKCQLIHSTVVYVSVFLFVCMVIMCYMVLLLVHQLCICVTYEEKFIKVIDEPICCMCSVIVLNFESDLNHLLNFKQVTLSLWMRKCYLDRLLSAFIYTKTHSITSSLEQLHYYIVYWVSCILFGLTLINTRFPGIR